MTSILIRTIVIYLLLSVSLRIMGKRQIGEMDISELVSTLLISEIASIPINEPDIPFLNAVIPILFIVSLEIILSTIKNKSEKLKSIIEGKPIYIIYKGRLLQKILKDNRISLNELMSEMRSQGVGSIDEIEYATIEQNGTISIFKKSNKSFAHPIIIDGEILDENLKGLGYDRAWLSKRLSELHVRKSQVFLLTVNDAGGLNLIRKDEKA